jgi:hypothetical protein
MKRARILIGIAAALIAVSVLPSGALAYGDAKGPPCADMTPGDAAGEGYPAVTGELVVRQQLSKAACDSLAYTIYVLDGTGTELITSASGIPLDFTLNDGSVVPAVGFIVDLNPFDTPDLVCFYMTTERNGRVLDRAPDIDDPLGSCASIAIGTGGGPRKYG